MEDKDLVVVCHCKKHNQLYHVENGVITTPLGPDVQYVDPYECEDATWDKVNTNSKQFVFSAACPVFAILEWDESSKEEDLNENQNNSEFPDRWSENLDNLFIILANARRVLKPGGQFIFPSVSSKEDVVPKIQDLIDTTPGVKKWQVSFVKDGEATFPIVAKDVPVYTGNKPSGKIWDFAEKKYIPMNEGIKRGIWPPKPGAGPYIVFTKPMTGGRRSRKSKRQMKKTRKQYCKA